MFDIDKMYIMRYALERDTDGTYVEPKSKKLRNDNLIVSTQLAILQSEQIVEQLFTPSGFETLKQLGYTVAYVEDLIADGIDATEAYKKAKELSVDDLKKVSSKSKNLIFNDVQVQFHKQNMIAAQMIGVFAQSNVSHGFISFENDQANPDTKNNPAIVIEDGFTLNGVPISGEVMIDALYTRDNQTLISTNLGELVAASVDAVKDPVFNLMNINMDTVNTVTSLVRLGFTLETAALLCAQPIIKQLIIDYNIKSKNSYGVTLNSIINEYIEDMDEETKSITDITLTDEDLISNLDGKSEVNNYMALKVFQKVMEISDIFRDIIHMTRYNSITSAVGPSAADTQLNLIKDEAFWSKVNKGIINTGVLQAINNPILKAFREDAYSLEREILGANMIQASTNFRGALTHLSKILGYERGVPSAIARAFTDFYMSYYVHSGPTGSIFDLSKDNRTYWLKQFPLDFNSLKMQIKDNALLNSIQVVSQDSEENSFLQLKTRGFNNTVIEDLKTAWIELYENEETRDLALGLVQYAFFRGTFGFNPKTFMNMVPNVIKTALPGYIDTLNEQSSALDGENSYIFQLRLMKQFILHHPELIKNRYYNLDSFNPKLLPGDKILINTKSEGRKSTTISTSSPFIIIDDKCYVIEQMSEDELVLQKVDLLGGDGQGIEMSTTEDYPSSIYDQKFTLERGSKGRKKSSASSTREKQIQEKQFAQALYDIYSEDETALSNLFGEEASDIIQAVNKAIPNNEASKRLPNTAVMRRIIINFTKKIKSADSIVDLIKNTLAEEDNKNLCS